MNEEQFKDIVSKKSLEIKELRKKVRDQEEQIEGLRSFVKDTSRALLAKEQTITQLKRKKAELSEDVFTAYDERARLLAVLASWFPSIIKVDLDALNPDYSSVLYIQLPTGQISFHIFKGQLDFLDHVPRMNMHGKFIEPWMETRAQEEGTINVEWDGHSTEEKWLRIRKYVNRSNLTWALDEDRSIWHPTRVINNNLSLNSPKAGLNISFWESQ